MEECKKLQSLRIAGIHASDHNGFLASLCVALPLATNLLDLTVFWRCRSAAELHTILTAIEKCPNLRRVMINPDMRESDPLFDLPGLSDKILRVINTLNRLNMFLLLMDVDPFTLDVTMEKIATQILPQRPSLFCYFGKPLSPCVASSPAIHLDQMLFPMNFIVPAKFLWFSLVFCWHCLYHTVVHWQSFSYISNAVDQGVIGAIHNLRTPDGVGTRYWH